MVINVVSTFAGCGGSSLGYKRAGCTVLLAIDFEKNAVKTYQMNFPDTTVWKENIRDITGDMILKQIGLQKGELDIFDGSPPCTPFSTSGIRDKGWNKEYVHGSETIAQRADDLFFEYIRLVDELKPKCFVGENVRGLIMGKSKGYFNEILRHMKSLGYQVKVFDINAKDFEVPQSRPRIIYIGIRNDIFTKWDKLTKNPEISFYEATKDLTHTQQELDEIGGFSHKLCYTMYSSMKPNGKLSKFHPKQHNFSCIKIDSSKPAPTIIAGGIGDIAHPYEKRPISVKEVKRLCSFPDDFKFISNSDAWIRMGNSVPPNLMKHIALYLQRCVDFT